MNYFYAPLYIFSQIVTSCFFIAVATHKYVISFCVGLELFNANTPKRLYATYIIVFSVMSMVGIAIGTTLTSGVAEESVPYAAMVGILQVRWIK